MPGFETLTPAVIFWILLVTLMAGVIQGALGLGYPTVATPLIALATDIWTAVIVVLLPCLATITTGLVVNRHLREALAAFWFMPLFALAGAAIGTRLFIGFPAFPYALLLALLIIVYLNLDRLGRNQWATVARHPRRWGLVFGVSAGVTEGTANVAAPPLIAYYLSLGIQPTVMVQAMLICFFAGKATQFVTLASSGTVPVAQWLSTLPLAALAAAATVYGIRIRNRIDADNYRRWLRGALWVIAAILLGQYGWSLFAA